MLGVTNEVPVPREVPPVEAAYQFNVPAPVVAPRVIVPVPHRLAGVVPVIVGTELTVATTAVRAEVQPSVTSTK